MQLQGDAFALLMGMGNVSNGALVGLDATRACGAPARRSASGLGLRLRLRLTFVFGSEADGAQGCS
jgi:hypothetical protein